jgi:predicted DNA-binding transcriptional regulator YafY
LAKISAVLPAEMRRELEASARFIGACDKQLAPAVDADLLRGAIRAERKLQIRYLDQEGTPTGRVVWPFALVYFDMTRMVMCWCELRNGFRNFRTDRIVHLNMLDERYPKNRQALLAEWRRTEYEPGRSILPETDSMAL